MNNNQDPKSPPASSLPTRETVPNSAEVRHQVDSGTSAGRLPTGGGSINDFRKPAPRSIEQIRKDLTGFTTTNPNPNPLEVVAPSNTTTPAQEGLTKSELLTQTLAKLGKKV